MADPRKRLVADGYDRIADRYQRWASSIEGGPRDRLIARLTDELPPRARVLDLGCGSGLPSTKQLAERFEVEFPNDSFDAVTAFHSLDHVPREELAPLLANVKRWLVPNGLLLASFGVNDEAAWTGDWLGVQMYFSSYQPDTTRGMLASAGFELLVDEVVEMREPDGPVTFFWVFAQRINGP